MAGVDLHGILVGLFKLALLAGAVFYTGRVLMSFRTEGPHTRPRMDWQDAAGSAGRLLVWLGVQALRLAGRMAMPILETLSEASADVGEWFLSRRHHEID